MASRQHDAVLREFDNTDDDEELDSEEEDLTTSSFPAVTVAVPAAVVSNGDHTPPPPATTATASAVAPLDSRPPSETKKPLFQRLWTDEDEIELLRGFLEYTTHRSGSSHHNDTALFYDQIKSKLQLDFNRNQLVEKLRRLKKKYRNNVNRINSGKELCFRSGHDQITFEISRKIWSNDGRVGVEDNIDDDDHSNPKPNPSPNLNPNGNELQPEERIFKSKKRSRPQLQEKRILGDGAALNSTVNSGSCDPKIGNSCSVAGVIEETVRSSISPLFKELMSTMIGGQCGVRGFGAAAMSPLPLGFGAGPLSLNFGDAAMEGRWRKQQILELEVYLKRLELMQHQIKAALEELRSTGR